VGTAVRAPETAFAEWFEVMSGDRAIVGRGLAGYRGGQVSGPLLLFNASFASGSKPPHALTLGPLDGFSSTMLALVGDPAPQPSPPPPPACDAGRPGTDQTGAAHSPGYERGARVGTPTACCALCASLPAGACNAWVFDTSSPAPPTADCWPCMGASGSKAAANRTLGWVALPSQRLVGGVSGYISELPPMHTVRFAIAGSSSGANDAMYAYGLLLRTAHGTQRVDKSEDVIRHKLSYWTDNGAYYEDDHWHFFFNATTHTPEMVLNKLKVEHAALGLHYGTYQLDPWWSDGDGDSKQDAAWYWAQNWTAVPEYFPSGLSALGMPLTLYSNLYAAAPWNVMTEWNWVQSATCARSCYAHVVPEQSYDFHSMVFDRGVQWGMNHWEIDFLSFFFLSFTDILTDVRAWDAYWEGLTRAAQEHGVPVQLCMDFPAIALNSVKWDIVTNARVNGDGFPGQVYRHDIFLGSLFYGALELAPFLDNIWSTSCQPGADNAFNNVCEPAVEAMAAIAALSAGPVGFGDGLGWANATLIAMTSRSDGVLLQPSLPAAPLDVWLAGLVPSAGAGARLAAAPTFIPLSPGAPPLQHAYPYPADVSMWATLIAVDTADVSVSTEDFSPPLRSGGGAAGFLVTRWAPGVAATRAACADGAPAAAGCAAALPAGGAFSAAAPGGVPADQSKNITFDLYSVAPVFSEGGWALVGEVDKFVRVSGARFAFVAPACDAGGAPSLCFGLTGAEGERVDVALVAPGGVVKRVTTALPAEGAQPLRVACKGAGAAASCA
jgi:hypothetical protein